MSDSKIILLNIPAEDPLHEVLKRGAKELLEKAVEAEWSTLLAGYSAIEVYGKKAVVRNGSGRGIKFNSALFQPYLKPIEAIDEFTP